MDNNIKTKALEFAIKAHKGQRRKSDSTKPMIIHPINVANILEENGFDDNGIGAGYLHDVVEDTKYSIDDIRNNFNDDIASLVEGASEPDKSLSWEVRKKHTIDITKNLDLRHKAIICADKISNLEDIMILGEINGNYDFSAFKRGFKDQKWYYEEVYNSLINNEDKDNLLFTRLKYLIDYVFEDKRNDSYFKDVIFKDNIEEYNKLNKLHYKKEELYKLYKVINNHKPYVIEFTGTPRTGKTTIINNLKDFFKKKGFKVELLEEFTTSDKYKSKIYPKLKDKYTTLVNTLIPKYVLKELEGSLNNNPDIIIIDRSLFDRLIWVDRLYNKGIMNTNEYVKYKNKYIPLINDKIDIIISKYTDSLTALKRDYKANFSLEKRNLLNEDNINEYNNALLNMEKLAKDDNINFHLFDTTNISIRDTSIKVADVILNDMKNNYLDEVNNEYK